MALLFIYSCRGGQKLDGLPRGCLDEGNYVNFHDTSTFSLSSVYFLTSLKFVCAHHTIKMFNGFFVDLFVRASNHLAIAMYTSLGYSVYRRVLGYYSGENEDANGRFCAPFLKKLK